MASLHDDAGCHLVRRPAAALALLTLALVAACGGDRTRAASTDTTGVSVATPDSATQGPSAPPSAPAGEPTATAPVAAPPADTSAKRAPPPRESKQITAAVPRDTTRVPKGDTSKSAAAPAPAPSRPDSSRPTTAAADAPLRDAYHQAPRDTVTQAVYSGWKQFNLNCARCHGEDVLGTTIAPHLIVSLKPDGPINTKELFVQTVCAGRPEKGMPAWCALGLEMDKINNIYEYVKGRSDAKIGPGRPAVKQQGGA